MLRIEAISDPSKGYSPQWLGILNAFVTPPPPDITADNLDPSFLVSCLSVFGDLPVEAAKQVVFERRRMDPTVESDAAAGLAVILEKGFIDEEFKKSVEDKTDVVFSFPAFRNFIVNLAPKVEESIQLHRKSEDKLQDRVVANLREKSTARQEKRRNTVAQATAETQKRGRDPVFEQYYADAYNARKKPTLINNDIQ